MGIKTEGYVSVLEERGDGLFSVFRTENGQSWFSSIDSSLGQGLKFVSQ